MQDLHTSLTYEVGAAPVVVADNTATATAVIDCLGCTALEFVIMTGTLADADATFAVLVEHDDASGFGTAAAVPDSDLIGTEADAGFTFAADGATRKIGYKMTKRYVKCTVTPSANTGNAPLAVLVVKAKRHTS